MAKAPSPISVAKCHSYNVVVKQFLDLKADVETPGLTCNDRSEANDHSSPMHGIGSN